MNGGMSQFNKKELHIITFRQKCILNIHYTEELSVILVIKSLFFKYHHTALLIKKGRGTNRGYYPQPP
jgi:hypothetical protein